LTARHLSIENPRAQDDGAHPKIAGELSGAYERLRTRLLEIYMSNVPMKSDRR
jgi:hypothetical protein